MTQDQLIKKCIDNNQSQKIVSLPLEFAYLPVDLIAKQFTKLNSPHPHRIHYLGPRYANTQAMHKKCAYSESSQLCKGTPDRKINKYRLDIKRIANSFFINERLRTNHFYKTGLYYRAFQGMNPTLDLQEEFLFNGSFESANLDCVIQVKPREFDLFLRIDSNTRGHLQWFYFSIQNGSNLGKIKLNICNISKSGTLYEQDMQPYIFSKKAFENHKKQWCQGNQHISNVSFIQKPFNYKILADKISINPFCYSFEYDFTEQKDQIYFAYCIPYTYSELLNDIQLLPKKFVRIYTLGRTLAGLDIPLLHITDHSQQNTQKRNILITGRIHPGQSNGSLVLKGFINFLCSSDKNAIQIRKISNFYIVPMLNPDGVVLGNSRCSASGRDLNRIFLNSDKQIFPQVFNLKTFTARFLNNKQILMYFDFHGHSRKKNTFFYGPSYTVANPNYLKCRVLPRIIQKINNGFRYHSCLFSISENKKTTGRASMFQQFQIPFTYTIQSSIGMYYDSQQLKTFLFDKQAYQKMGSSICQATSTFVTALDQYQNFLKQRRAQRQKKRIHKSSLSRRTYGKTGFVQDEILQGGKNVVLKISYTERQDCLFIKLLQQIKKLPQIVPTSQKGEQNEQDPIDQQASSDDHDDKQDFQTTKLKQFNNLIIQNARKDNLMSKLTETQVDSNVKGFIRSSNISSNNISVNKNHRNWQAEQLQFFQEMNAKTKSKTSHGKRDSILEERSATANLKRKNFSRENAPMQRNHKSYNNQHQYEQNQNIKETNFKTTANMFNDSNNKVFGSKTQTRFRSSTMNRIQQHYQNSRGEKAPHFSQLQFPQNQKTEEKKLLRHQKTDLFRRNLQRKREKSGKARFEGVNCSEMAIIKHPHKDLIDYDQIKKKKMTQFKIDDLMSNLQFRSKIMRDSVKYKDQKKQKVKSNFMFPSSFYGMKQQLNSKKRPNYSRQHSQSLEQPIQLTVKQFYK